MMTDVIVLVKSLLQRLSASDYPVVNSMIPENGVGAMDRGFACWEFINDLSATQTRFVVRIKTNMKTAFEHQCYRVVWFCDLESQVEFRLATNLNQLTNDENW